MPLPVPLSIPVWVVLLVFSVIFTWVLFHFFRPLPRLERKLKTRKIEPEAALLLLANHPIDDNRFREQLEHLRFSRKKPQREDVLLLIQRAKRGQ